ncbi:MAG: hypothetical protein DSZ05_07455 [Sulfurospirillum sp.]|nr:MAG: hypothetical protein DSZ05_07455 [Sulfurospirillum sp.]
MKRALILSAIVSVLVLFAGCIIIDDSLDYRSDLSDYEVKKIVRKVLVSQNSINRAGLVTSDGLEKLITNRSRYYDNRISCTEGGYITFTLSGGDLSVSFTTDTLLHIVYDDCRYRPFYYEQSRLNGSLDIRYNQRHEDARGKLLDFTIRYFDTSLYTKEGSVRINGEMGVHYDEAYWQHQLALVFSSNRLEIANRDYYERDIFTNIVLEYGIDTRTYHYTYHYSGTLYNSYLGTLSFTTLDAMQGYSNQNPQKGRFKISNAHVTLRVVPIDDYYVDIIVEGHDYTGQNRTIHTTWINIGL